MLWALEQARQVDAVFEVHHVVHDPAEAPGYYHKSDAVDLEPLEVRASEMLGEFLAEIGTSHPDLEMDQVESSLSVGLPATRILDVAAKTGATQIVMGSQGRTGLAHLLLGSKAERVAQLSPIPVTIVKSPPSEPLESDA